MMTKNSSYSRIVAVWLVLLAFLCGMIVPSLALAIQDMEIAMEGDPDDGLDFSGGGGGGQGDGNDIEAASPDYPHEISISWGISLGYWSYSNSTFVIWFDAKTGMFLVFPSIENQPRRANR